MSSQDGTPGFAAVETCDVAMEQEMLDGAEAGFNAARRLSTTADGQGLAAWLGTVALGTALGAIYGIARGARKAPARPRQKSDVSPVAEPWGPSPIDVDDGFNRGS